VSSKLFYAAYGWLTFSGGMHFAIDVVSQRLRGVRPPGPETTLYYGLHSSFALGQVVLGVLGLWLALRLPDVVRAPAVLLVSVLAALAWLTISLLFIEYWQPKLNTAVFVVLMLAAALSVKT
jgi:hypothetical protein